MAQDKDTADRKTASGENGVLRLNGERVMPALTIITPTYNRADCLKTCWASLKAQTNKDFQWLIVDDGSTDATSAAIQGICQKQNTIRIDWIQKENGGKHTALNAAHPLIRGKYVVILDSDDHLVPEAVSLILQAWEKYETDAQVGRIIFLKGYTVDKPICYVKNENLPLDTLREPRIAVTGRDCCDTFRTELFRKYPFPVFSGERFIGEGAAFFGMELESKGVYINKVIYLCDYREDGLTKAGRKMRLQNPLGGMYNSRTYMHPKLPLKRRIEKGILYSCYA
jgi:glycosyltransferase involved in cell wall biosynthesis